MSFSFETVAGADSPVEISRNSSQLTTNILSITAADRLAYSRYSNSTMTGAVNVATCTILAQSDVIRPHTNAVANDSTRSSFRITKVSN